MKSIFFLLLSTFLFSGEYMAKIEPFEIYTIKSAVSGKVVKSSIEKEFKSVKNEEIIKIDSKVDEANLKSLKEKLKNLEKIVSIDKKTLKNLEKLTKIKEENYNRIKDLKTKSKFEKDAKLSDFLLTKNQLLSQKEKIKNLENQIEDIKYSIKKLEDNLDKKRVVVSGYIYKIYVKKGDFVNLSSPLIDIADISKGKITIYLSYDDIDNIDKKDIYINGKKSNLKFYKISKIADNTNITSYKAEILIESPKIFSKLIKVEIK